MGIWTKIGLGAAGLGLFSVVGAASAAGYMIVTFGPAFPDTPYPQLAASSDPAVIEQGRYVFHAVAHCTICHAPKEEVIGNDDIWSVVPRGGHEWVMGPIGTVRSANLTPHASSPVSDYTDAELARLIKTAVARDHRVPMMMIAIGPMADEDIVAVMSYVRSLEPVANDVPPSEFTAVGKVMIGAMMPAYLHPKPWQEPPPYVPVGDISVERGRYLAEGAAMCFLCHSQVEFGPPAKVLEPYFAGQTAPDPDPEDATMEIMAPNLTSHPTGRTGQLSEDAFVARLRDGREVASSPMPWENYRHMTDEDLRSIYRYLASVEPVDRDTGPTYRAAGWAPK